MLDTKHHKDIQLQGPELPMKYPNNLVENRFEIKESDGNMLNPIF